MDHNTATKPTKSRQLLQSLKRIAKRIRSYLLLDQWIILIAPNSQGTMTSWADFKAIIPPPDRDWADPFVWLHEGQYFIFIEEKPYSTDRGRINCLVLDEQLNVSSNRVVLERPYHLSYPFLFTFKGQLYMLPETKENHSIELYKCTHFPDQWVFENTLLNNVKAVDATLLKGQDKWWLFANIQEDGGSSWDALHLFYADSPLSNDWKPHSHNPIVNNRRSARPAGNILLHDGNLIRPSQDCSIRYGYATNFNRIVTLTESEYSETLEQRLEPPIKGNIRGTHTWNEAGGLKVIDAILRRHLFRSNISLN